MYKPKYKIGDYFWLGYVMRIRYMNKKYYHIHYPPETKSYRYKLQRFDNMFGPHLMNEEKKAELL